MLSSMGSLQKPARWRSATGRALVGDFPEPRAAKYRCAIAGYVVTRHIVDQGVEQHDQRHLVDSIAMQLVEGGLAGSGVGLAHGVGQQGERRRVFPYLARRG